MTLMDKLVFYMVLIIIFETILECLRWPFDHLVLGVNWLGTVAKYMYRLCRINLYRLGGKRSRSGLRRLMTTTPVQI